MPCIARLPYKNFDLDSTSGLRVADPHGKFLEQTHIYKFQKEVNSNRSSSKDNLQTGEQKTLSPTIDQDGESIHTYMTICLTS